MAQARLTGSQVNLLLKRWVLAFVAPRPLVGMLYLFRYLRDWRSFSFAAPIADRPEWKESYPCLTDWVAATPFDPHYFFQGAWLARRLRKSGCALHVDVGSSVMMINVLSAQVPVVFVDYRPLTAKLPDLTSLAADIKCLPFADDSIASLSSLHVLEHIGLGRYGDPLDPDGSVGAARELARVLAPGGRLYVSVPTGRTRVCFNAHRVFAPVQLKAMFDGLRCTSFSLVNDAGSFVDVASEAEAGEAEYACGMYEFVKP